MASSSRKYQIVHDPNSGSSTISFECFDTRNSLEVYGCENAEKVLMEMRSLCLRFDALWSFTNPESDVARINNCEHVAKVHAPTVDLLKRALAFQIVEPAFDITVGPVSYIWKHASEVPSQETIMKALRHVHSDSLHVDGETVMKEDADLKVDVGGVAKGYIADALAVGMRHYGINSAKIDLGGNLYLVGEHPAGRPWRLDVFIPEDVPAPPVRFQVCDASVVTSGTYERYVEIDGKRYSHLIDARTGMPCNSDVVSATVIDSSSLRADLLSTVALIEGTKGFDALVKRHSGSSFIVVAQDGRVLRHEAEAIDDGSVTAPQV